MPPARRCNGASKATRPVKHRLLPDHTLVHGASNKTTAIDEYIPIVCAIMTVIGPAKPMDDQGRMINVLRVDLDILPNVMTVLRERGKGIKKGHFRGLLVAVLELIIGPVMDIHDGVTKIPNWKRVTNVTLCRVDGCHGAFRKHLCGDHYRKFNGNPGQAMCVKGAVLNPPFSRVYRSVPQRLCNTKDAATK